MAPVTWDKEIMQELQQERTDQELFDGYGKLSTAAVSDALDALRLPGSAAGLSAVVDCRRMIGRAFTVRYVPAALEPGSVGDYIDEVPAGAVVVIDNAARTDCTVWGGILTEVASRRALAGTVINGVCRDVATSRELDYPLFTRGRFMRTGKDRVEVPETGGLVSLGDVRVLPGDLLIGDDDGVVVVPRSHEARVLEVAQRLQAAEDRIIDAVRGGASLEEARRANGYHQLQRAGYLTN